MNRIETLDNQLRKELNEALNNAGREKMKLLERIQKEAKISFQNLYKFRRGDKSSHNIGFKQLSRLNDWLDNN
jgi:hypothetical protein